MRILAAFICMSLICVVATVLAVISALIQILPVLLILAAVLAVVRWRGRAARQASGHVNAGPPAAIASPAARTRPITPRPAGWVLVPVWAPASDAPERHHYIDAEIVSEDHQHD
jgi:hypothetical protein